MKHNIVGVFEVRRSFRSSLPRLVTEPHVRQKGRAWPQARNMFCVVLHPMPDRHCPAYWSRTAQSGPGRRSATASASPYPRSSQHPTGTKERSRLSSCWRSQLLHPQFSTPTVGRLPVLELPCQLSNPPPLPSSPTNSCGGVLRPSHYPELCPECLNANQFAPFARPASHPSGREIHRTLPGL